MPDDADSLPSDDDLGEAWQLLMGLVMDQRWRWAEVAATLNVSQAGLRALLAIDPDEPRPMRDLAVSLNCDASYVTAMVDDLERAGYAERRPGLVDRRVKMLALTPAGQRALRTVQDELLAPPEQIASLPAAKRTSLARLLLDALSPASLP